MSGFYFAAEKTLTIDVEDVYCITYAILFPVTSLIQNCLLYAVY